MRIKVKEGTSPPIEVKSNPMSPLLFNLAVDPLIHKLEEIGEGYMFEGQKVTPDDLVLMSSSWAGMQHNIKVLEIVCQLSGLRVQPRKCHGFMVR